VLLLIWWLTVVTSIRATNTNAAAAVVRAVEARYAGRQTLQADFYERYRSGGNAGQAESGIVYFSKPGRMRWEYEAPEKKLFVVDGKNVWFYIPADRTATRASVKESQDWRTPLALLTGKIHLDHLCEKTELLDEADAASSPGDMPSDPGNRILRCLPHKPGNPGEEPAFREILLEVSPEFQIVRVVIREPGDIETEFRFGNWVENPPLKESIFHFEPPAGVTIVNEEEIARGVH
jgi:outer membrane lipoprotein carrier protein